MFVIFWVATLCWILLNPPGLESIAFLELTIVLGLIGTVSSILGHFIGAGLAIKNGSKIVKPAIIIVLILLAAKVVQGLIAG